MVPSEACPCGECYVAACEAVVWVVLWSRLNATELAAEEHAAVLADLLSVNQSDRHVDITPQTVGAAAICTQFLTLPSLTPHCYHQNSYFHTTSKKTLIEPLPAT